MNGFKEWWSQNSVRDQFAMVILGFCFGLFILYVGILKPFQTKRDTQLQVNESARASLGRVREMAALYKNQGNAAAAQTSGRSIVEIVDTSLRANSLRLTSMRPSGMNDVQLRMDQVRFNDLLVWLAEMEVNEGMQVKDLSVSTTDNPGIVSVNIRLHNAN